LLELILLPLIGFLVAVSVGLSGIGGAAFTVPALVWLGVPPQQVVGATLLFIFLTNTFGIVLHQREHNVSITAIKYLAIGVIPAIPLGTLAFLTIRDVYGSFILDTVIVLGTGSLLAIVSMLQIVIMTHVRKSKLAYGNSPYDAVSEPSIRSRAALAISGFLISFYIQLTSVGTGTLLVPILLRIIHSPRHVAGTTSAFALLVTALGSLFHFTIGNLPLMLVGLLIVGALPGVYVGVKGTTRTRPVTLGILASSLVLLAAILLLVKGVTALSR